MTFVPICKLLSGSRIDRPGINAYRLISGFKFNRHDCLLRLYRTYQFNCLLGFRSIGNYQYFKKERFYRIN